MKVNYVSSFSETYVLVLLISTRSSIKEKKSKFLDVGHLPKVVQNTKLKSWMVNIPLPYGFFRFLQRQSVNTTKAIKTTPAQAAAMAIICVWVNIPPPVGPVTGPAGTGKNKYSGFRKTSHACKCFVLTISKNLHSKLD